MSKSKGEFLTVSLLEEKGYDPMVYRLFCLGSHYRKSLVFSFENLDNAAASYKKLIAKLAALLPEKDGAIDKDAFDKHRADFCAALDNDLNTSLAITALYDVLKANINAATKLALAAEFDKVLTLNLIEAAEKMQSENAGAGEDDEATAWIRELIEARVAAKKAKNFAEADRIRDELAAKGVTLIDTREGTKFEIKA